MFMNWCSFRIYTSILSGMHFQLWRIHPLSQMYIWTKHTCKFNSRPNEFFFSIILILCPNYLAHVSLEWSRHWKIWCQSILYLRAHLWKTRRYAEWRVEETERHCLLRQSPASSGKETSTKVCVLTGMPMSMKSPGMASNKRAYHKLSNLISQSASVPK